MKPDEKLLTVEEVAQYLSFSSWSVYQLCAKGSIPHIRINRSIRFKRKEVDKWLDNSIPERAVTNHKTHGGSHGYLSQKR